MSDDQRKANVRFVAERTAIATSLVAVYGACTYISTVRGFSEWLALIVLTVALAPVSLSAYWLRLMVLKRRPWLPGMLIVATALMLSSSWAICYLHAISILR
jgi:hypothetical protein